MLSVAFVMGLVMTAVALAIGPLVNAQNRTQAKVDTVQAVAMALYRVERDLRSTKSDSVWACTTSGTPTCTAPTASLGATDAIVIATAYANGTGQFQVDSSNGKPNWQGAAVYWVDSSGYLNFAFDFPTASGYSTGNLLSAADARVAVSDVLAAGGKQLAQPIEQMSIAVPPSTANKVSFQLQTTATEGASSNELTLQTDLETRN